MSNRTAFVLPLSGLGKGLYEYDLTVDDAFFARFSGAPIGRCAVDVHLTLDRRGREMTLDFALAGTIGTDCDRCLASIDLPVEDRHQLVVKFNPEVDEPTEEGDLVYLHPDTAELDLAPYVYEMVLLALPMIRTYDCRSGQPPYPCDEDLLDRIDALDEGPAAASVPTDTDREANAKPSSPWDVLKNLNNND